MAMLQIHPRLVDRVLSDAAFPVLLFLLGRSPKSLQLGIGLHHHGFTHVEFRLRGDDLHPLERPVDIATGLFDRRFRFDGAHLHQIFAGLDDLGGFRRHLRLGFNRRFMSQR